MMREKSCGAVVYTRQNGQIKFVLARSREGVYGFPKGHVEAGETERETALREIGEEVGLHPTLIEGFRTTSEYVLPNKKHVMKLVVFFLAEYADETIVPQKKELTGAALVTYEEALTMLRHEENKRVLREAHAFLETMQ